MRTARVIGFLSMRMMLMMLMVAGCAGGTTSPSPGGPTGDPGKLRGDPTLLDPDVQAYASQLQGDLKAARALDRDALTTRYALPFSETLSYDPIKAEHLDLIQKSSLKLQDAELGALAKQGFVLAAAQRYPSFAYGYASIYSQDLPVYISADSILDALHHSYASMLKAVEVSVIGEELDVLLQSLRAKLSQRTPTSITTDLDLYLSVSQALLDGAVPADAPQAARNLVSLATAAAGLSAVELFGVKFSEDFSQYKPRGHYEENAELQQYFRAMMWLGRIDFRLVEADGGTQRLNRPPVEAMLLLASLFDDADRRHFTRIDETLRLFVGESDNMTLSQVPMLLDALGLSDVTQLGTISDDQLKQTILSRGFGKQQILNQLVEGGLDAPVPLSASFLMFGQRYTVDSHVLSNVVWDRTRAMRMMPNPLDVAFAALGNDQAVNLLHDDLTKYSYAGDLAAMRELVDQHDDAFWHANLYNDWLSAVRALSPTKEAVSDPHAHGMPELTKTAAWGRRVLGAQLGSWAQLRHDTILYSKQSYTSGAVCEFPDAAVDPYPEFYAALARFAEHGVGLSKVLDGAAQTALIDRMTDYFMQLRAVASSLQGIAQTQAAQTALSADQLAFINDAVVIKRVAAGCTSVEQAAGWYARLFFNQADALAFDPTIADVHTQPTDEVGTDVGRILHVATGLARLMVITQDGCGGARAYVGLASSYYEKVTEHWQRQADSDWSPEVMNTSPQEPAWMQDLVNPTL